MNFGNHWFALMHAIRMILENSSSKNSVIIQMIEKYAVGPGD